MRTWIRGVSLGAIGLAVLGMSIVTQAQSTSSRIVYAHNGAIYKMIDSGTLNGPDPVALTSGSGDMRPTICPSGRAVYFERAFDIYRVGQNGGIAVQVTDTNAYEGDPDCAHFGSNDYVLFVADYDDGPSIDDVYRMNLNGTNPVNLTDTEDVDEDSPTACGSSRIAFARDAANNKGEIWTADVSNGDNDSRETDGELDFEPTCRSDGSRIAFSRVVGPPQGDPYVDVFEKNLSTGLAASVTDGVAFDVFYPVYSPGALYIAFSGSPGNNSDIYRLLLDEPTAEAEQLTDDSAEEMQPDWGELAP